jgi:hypothetical protein
VFVTAFTSILTENPAYLFPGKKLAHREQRNPLVALIAGNAHALWVKDWLVVHEELISVVTVRYDILGRFGFE